jgi:hypothetical protein
MVVSVSVAKPEGVGVGGGRSGVTVAEAAQALGISVNAVKLRLRRGTLVSYRDDEGHVRVVLPDRVGDVPTPTPTPLRPRPRTDTSDTTGDEGELARIRAVLVEVQRQRDHLEQQVTALTARLDTEATERAEMRRLIAGALQRLPEGDGEGVSEGTSRVMLTRRELIAGAVAAVLVLILVVALVVR